MSVYLRVYQPKGIGQLGSPGMPDLPFIPIPPTSVDPYSSLVRASGSSVFTTGGPTDTFIVGTTMPVLADPLNPTGADNVGWDGTVTATYNTLTTVASGQTISNAVFNTDVILTDATSKLRNCVIYGGAPVASRPGFITANNGGQLERCTVYGKPASMVYYRNGVSHRGGLLTITRCAFYRTTDAINSSGSDNVLRVYGSLRDRAAFWDNDLDQANGTPPNWSHNDFIQVKSGVGPHDIVGNYMLARVDTTGVTGPHTGAASGSSIGQPATQLNAGYWNSFFDGLYCNGITFSNVSGFQANISYNWLEGTNNPSALIQFTTGTTNKVTLKGNRVGLGGWRASGANKFLISYPAGTTAVVGTAAEANIYAATEFPSVPVPLRGTALPFTTGGAKYVP